MKLSKKITQAAQYIARTRSQNGVTVCQQQVESIFHSYFSYSNNDSIWDYIDYYDQHHEEYFVTDIIETCPPKTVVAVGKAANESEYSR